MCLATHHVHASLRSFSFFLTFCLVDVSIYFFVRSFVRLFVIAYIMIIENCKLHTYIHTYIHTNVSGSKIIRGKKFKDLIFKN